MAILEEGELLKLYIDADAFVNLLKPIVTKAIVKKEIETIVVSNKKVSLGIKSPFITYIIVEAGADEADHKIVEMLSEGDLVITADIPLADRVITKKAHAIDHRGALYTEDNIKQYLTMRNFMEEMRDSGVITGGPKPYGQKDAHEFANQFNNFLNKYL